MTSIHSLLHDLSWADWQIPDPGAGGIITPVRTGICDIVTATAEARTLADPPRAGIILAVNMVTDGGDCTIAANTSGGTSIVLNDAGDFVLLMSRKLTAGSTGFGWAVVVNIGATIS